MTSWLGVSDGGGGRAGVLQGAEETPRSEVVGAELGACRQRRAPRIRQSEREQLAGVVPLVQRLGGVDALVALQADQRGVEHERQCLGGLGLAGTRLALEQ